YVSTALGVDINRIRQIDVVKRSIDARQRRVMVNLSIRVHLDEITPADDCTLPEMPVLEADAPQAIVVGAGPAGLFASLQLIKEGIRPIMLERGKDVDSRRADMAAIAREGRVDPDSNYCFGEGGAGAFSDGKLYTRSKKRGSVEDILKILVANGASSDILADAHPHIGSDRLPGVIKSIRESIKAHGGEVHFNTAMHELVITTDSDGTRRVTGVTDRSGRVWNGPVILATGHSARDLYRTLYSQGVEMEPKGLAVGVRLEHPQRLIDSIMYHSPAGRGKYLPAAEYSMLTRVDGRAVYSFCMCPGGVVIPSASAPGQSAVNGMSASARSSRWSNSGMVVEVLPEDVPGDDPLKMLTYQE
ncbi:MAG: FAD-dependent monooxygenase, partial [Muribaculaceae bacterium]|nr:FAD-dependent monooxygenase [Muribaculaceae bacterium]